MDKNIARILLIAVGVGVVWWLSRPSSESLTVAEDMCQCSEDVNWENLGSTDPSIMVPEITSFYECWAESDDFLTFMDLDTSSSIFEIEDKYVEKFSKIDKALEETCPDTYDKMTECGMIIIEY